MLCKSWPDARRHMMNISYKEWPKRALRRAVKTVSTPSELSDALALLASNMQHNSQGTRDSFRHYKDCFLTLAKRGLQGDRMALHLVSRMTDVLVDLVDRFPKNAAASTIINDFVRLCADVRDVRASQAIVRLLSHLQSKRENKACADMEDQLVSFCITSIEDSMSRSSEGPSSSESFAKLPIIFQLLRHEFRDVKEQQRALQCAVYIAGRERDDRRVRLYFEFLQQTRAAQKEVVSGLEYLHFAKALVRTESGRKDAWRALQRAEELIAKELEGERPRRQKARLIKDLYGAHFDFLQIMAKSSNKDFSRVFSLMGIVLPEDSRPNGGRRITSSESPRPFERLMKDVYAYTVVMQGCLVRGRSELAITVWKVMLKRGLLPSAACLSVYLQNLFGMREVESALRELNLWCEQGVQKPVRQQGVEAGSLPLEDSSPATTRPASKSIDQGDGLYKVEPDPILASVVFSGIHRCGTGNTEALWTAYQQTIRLFPDAPVLALLLKASSGGKESSSSTSARFGRQVFRSLLFVKHPDLATHRNTLKEELNARRRGGWLFSDDTVGSRMEKMFSSVFQTADIAAPEVPQDLSGLVFTSKVFEHYARLLLHLQHSPGSSTDSRLLREELIDVLGWMKELDLTPSKTHLALTVLEIEEHLPPAVAARQMDLLDDRLREWFGSKNVPGEIKMQRHWEWKMKRNGSAKGWFDSVNGPSRTF